MNIDNEIALEPIIEQEYKQKEELISFETAKLAKEIRFIYLIIFNL